MMGIKKGIGIVVGAGAILYQAATGAFTNFIVAGIIPGTTHAIPAWAMFGICCLATTFVITIFVEDFVYTIRRKAFASRQQALPKRRQKTAAS